MGVSRNAAEFKSSQAIIVLLIWAPEKTRVLTFGKSAPPIWGSLLADGPQGTKRENGTVFQHAIGSHNVGASIVCRVGVHSRERGLSRHGSLSKDGNQLSLGGSSGFSEYTCNSI